MNKAKKRVIIWGTGNNSAIAIRCIEGRDDMELVGVWGHPVFDKGKIGMDSGLLDGDKENGILITDNEEELLTLKPDCAFVGVAIPGMDTIKKTGEIFIKLLNAGINIVSPSIPGLICPSSFPDQELVAKIEKAAKDNNVSLYIGGQEPGLSQQLTAVLLSGSNTIKKITTSEIYVIGDLALTDFQKELCGFTMPEDYQCQIKSDNFQLVTWGMSVAYIANILGYKVDEFKESVEQYVTDKDIVLQSGTIKAGTVAGIRYGIIGIINGKEVIRMDHIMRSVEGIAPEWPSSSQSGTLLYEIEGDPCMTCELKVGTPEYPEDLTYSAYVLTAMSNLNAISNVCNAKPGIITSDEMKIAIPTNALRSETVKVNHKVL